MIEVVYLSMILPYIYLTFPSLSSIDPGNLNHVGQTNVPKDVEPQVSF
jgi:hypothetical protein